MTRAITLFPGSGECEDLTYYERVSCDRGLHVLLQDYSKDEIPTRRRFLLSAYREIISRYLSFGKIEHPRPLAVRLVDVLDDLSKKLDCWVGDYKTLGIYVLFQDGDVCYLLASADGAVRLRLQGEFVDIDPENQPEVTRLPIEAGKSQKELFDNNFHDSVTLYKIQVPENGSLDVVMGGKGEDFTAVSDALRRPSVFEGIDRHASVPQDSISRKVLFVRTGVVERKRNLPPEYAALKGSQTVTRRGTVAFAVVAAIVFAALGAIWVSERLAGDGVERGGVEVAAGKAPVEAPEAAVAPDKRDAAGSEALQPVVAKGDAENAKTPGDTLSVKLAVLWYKSYSQPVTSSPLLVGNMVVFGCRDGRLYALDKNDGRVLWRHSAAGGIGASPALGESGIITADYAGNVSALARDDGKVLWNRKLPQKVVSSPVISRGEALIGCFDGTAYGLSMETGRVLWKVKTGDRIRATPAKGGGTYFIPSYDGKLYAVSEGTGTVKWAYQFGGPLSSSPAADEEHVVLGGADGAVYSLDAKSGQLQWKFDTAGAVKSFVQLEGGRVYAGSNDRSLYCLEAATGDLVWKYSTRGVVFSRPVMIGDKLFFASYDGNVYCLNAKTGEEIDRFGSNGAVYSSPVADGKDIYFGNNEGKFYCLAIYNKGTS